LGSSRAKHANSERLNEFDDEKRMADQSICHRQTDGIAKALGAGKAFNGCHEIRAFVSKYVFVPPPVDLAYLWVTVAH